MYELVNYTGLSNSFDCRIAPARRLRRDMDSIDVNGDGDYTRRRRPSSPI